MEFDGDSKSASLFVPEDAKGLSSYIRFKDRISGEKYRLSDNGIILTEKVCSLLGIKIGDTVIIKEGETKTVRAKVEHITENYMHHNIYMSKDLYQKLYGEEPEYNQILLKDKDRSEKTETDLGKGLLKQEGWHLFPLSLILKRDERYAEQSEYCCVFLIVSADSWLL